jgi:hypothetical protein
MAANLLAENPKRNGLLTTKLQHSESIYRNTESNCVPRGAGIAQSVLRRDTGWTDGVLLPARAISKASRPALGPIQPPVQWVPRGLFTEVKRSEREDDHSPPSSADGKNGGAILPLLHTTWCCGAIKQRHNFT